MFKSAELERTISKANYHKKVPNIRTALLEIQKKLGYSNTAVVLLIGGVEGAGKTEFANTLLEWMDPRGIQVHALAEPTDEERNRPRFWRFWRILPPKKKMAILLTSWYSDVIVNRVFKKINKETFIEKLKRIAEFESMLANENVLLIKFWFHLSKQRQKERLEKLEQDPDTRWRVTKTDWKFFAKYDRFKKVSETAIMKTHSANSPWNVIDATDKRYRTITALNIILETLNRHLVKQKEKQEIKPKIPKLVKVNIIRKLDLGLSLDEKTYKNALDKYQGTLNLLTRKMRTANRSLILVFEGPDAAGKGGAIRRLTQAMDARIYRVISFAAPTDEERAHPYLWRFWRNLPQLGKVSIYDRSWYGRVLVERIEGFCTDEEWKRAYAEIKAFEEQLSDFGTLVLKFWIAISPEEQLKRFKDREKTPYKHYKLTDEDWRNRKKWDAYETAAVEMIEKTSTEQSPWILVEGNDKNFARMKILRIVCKKLEGAI
ncbi:MAG: polyphosphate:AMP phosphotransferase [Elusimicrobiota bacterium]|nr:polyphosphate:AMP phosphotransferase [Elusimicrobiota bacterium]